MPLRAISFAWACLATSVLELRALAGLGASDSPPNRASYAQPRAYLLSLCGFPGREIIRSKLKYCGLFVEKGVTGELPPKRGVRKAHVGRHSYRRATMGSTRMARRAGM